MMYINERTKQIYQRIEEDRYVNQYDGKATNDPAIINELIFVGIQHDLIEAKKLLTRKRTYYILEAVNDNYYVSSKKNTSKGFYVTTTDDYENSVLFYDFWIALDVMKDIETYEGELRIRKLKYNAKKKTWYLDEWAKQYQ